MAVLKKSPVSIPPKIDDNQSDIDRSIITDAGQRLMLCPGCGRMFEPYRSFQRYCSDRCRVKVEKRRPSRYKKKAIVARVCKNCGQEFKTSDDKRHYCSNACYIDFQAKRRRDPEVRRCMNPACDREFTTTHWAKRYCSEACRKAVHAL